MDCLVVDWNGLDESGSAVVDGTDCCVTFGQSWIVVDRLVWQRI